MRGACSSNATTSDNGNVAAEGFVVMRCLARALQSMIECNHAALVTMPSLGRLLTCADAPGLLRMFPLIQAAPSDMLFD